MTVFFKIRKKVPTENITIITANDSGDEVKYGCESKRTNHTSKRCKLNRMTLFSSIFINKVDISFIWTFLYVTFYVLIVV